MPRIRWIGGGRLIEVEEGTGVAGLVPASSQALIRSCIPPAEHGEVRAIPLEVDSLDLMQTRAPFHFPHPIDRSRRSVVMMRDPVSG